jgi:hypothetical protein
VSVRGYFEIGIADWAMRLLDQVPNPGYTHLNSLLQGRKEGLMPCGRKRKLKKIATHKRKKKLRKNRHKNKK